MFGLFHVGAHLPTQRPILADQSIEAMQSPQLGVVNGHQYGFGWWLSDRFGYRFVEAQGGNNSATALVRLVPSERIVVAVVSNTGMNSSEIADEILAALLPEFRSKASTPSSPPPAKPTVVDTLAGAWQGEVRRRSGRVPLTLSIDSSGGVRARFGSEPVTSLTRTAVRNRFVYGVMPASLAEPDHISQPHEIELYLELRGDRLVGSATTRARPGIPGPPTARLPYWVELSRQ